MMKHGESNVKESVVDCAGQPIVREAHFLDDNPLDDLGDDGIGTHKRIAEALVREITEGNPANIAIVGEWGSGKSTVLALAEKQLTNNANSEKEKGTAFFTFDAWSHPTETLRKSFLLSLGDSLFAGQAGNSNDSSWTETRKRLTGVELLETRIEKLRLSLLVSFLAMLAVLYFIFKEVADALAAVFPCVPTAAIVFVPMGLAFGLSIFLTKKLDTHRKKEGVKPPSCLPDTQKTNWFDDLVALLLGHPNSTAVQTITKSPDLDAVQFEIDYRKILETEKLNQKKVVIAIDNLDRLPEEKLEAAWSSIQIFANQRTVTLLGKSRPWILLPIARRAFGKLSKSEEDTEGTGIGAISKLFVRQFEIPTPITTDWKKCFTGYLLQAFPTISGDEKQQVFSIADSLKSGRVERTPREAIRFINSMVSMAKLHTGSEMSSYALYALITASKTGNSGLNKEGKRGILLGEDTAVNEHLAVCYGDNIQRGFDELAMMMYGVFTPEAAREIFISQEVDRAIEKQISLNVQAIVENKTGAWDTLFEVLSTKIKNTEGETNAHWISRFYVDFQDYADSEGSDENLRRIQMTLIRALPQSHWPVIGGFAIRTKDILFDVRFGQRQRADILKFIIGTSAEWPERLREASKPEINQQFQLWATETADVLNAYETENELPQQLDFAEFADSYWKLLKGLSHASSKITWFGRIDEKSTTVFYSILDGAINDEHIYNDSENGRVLWDLIEQSSVRDIDAETYQIDLARYTNDEIKSLKLFFTFWIAKNVYQITLPLQKNYLENYQILQESSEQVFGSFEAYPLNCQIALVDNVFKNSEIESYENHATRLLATTPDFSNIAERYGALFGKEFKYLIERMNDTDIGKIAKALLEQYWTEEACSLQPLSICLAYAERLTSSEKTAFGERLARAGRESDLIESTFSHKLESLYLGFLNVDETNALGKWISKALDTTTAKNWEEWLKRIKSEAIDLVRRCNHTPRSLIDYTEKCLDSNNLDPIICHRLMDGIIATQELMRSLDAAIGDYNSDRWKSIIKAFKQELVLHEWFIQTTVNTRMNVLETICRKNTAELYVWFADMLGNRDQARKLLSGNIQRTRDLLSNVVKRKKIPSAGREACERILTVLM
jgi:hypothetical protein